MRRHRRVHTMHTRRRRVRHNPPAIGGMVRGLGATLKGALFGAAAIAATNVLSNQVGTLVKLDATTANTAKPLIRAGIALLAIPWIGKATNSPQLAASGQTALASVIYDYAKTLPTVGPYLSGDENKGFNVLTEIPTTAAVLPPARFT